MREKTKELITRGIYGTFVILLTVAIKELAGFTPVVAREILGPAYPVPTPLSWVTLLSELCFMIAMLWGILILGSGILGFFSSDPRKHAPTFPADDRHEKGSTGAPSE